MIAAKRAGQAERAALRAVLNCAQPLRTLAWTEVPANSLAMAVSTFPSSSLSVPQPLIVALWNGAIERRPGVETGSDLDANARAITAAISQAAALGADIVVTPECALTGYAPALGEWPSTNGRAISWCAVAEHEEQLAAHAANVGIALLLGSAGPLIDSNEQKRGSAGPLLDSNEQKRDPASALSNDAWWCGAVTAPVRYRKRCLTPADQAYFTAGSTPVVVEHRGWRLGLAICFDVRSAAVWHQLGRLGADAVLCPAYMAGSDPDPGCKAVVVPNFFSVRAAELAAPVALANCAAADRWLESGAWDARGLPLNPVIHAALSVVTLSHRRHLDPWYEAVRTVNVAHSSQFRATII